jgi:hypothetical protein
VKGTESQNMSPALKNRRNCAHDRRKRRGWNPQRGIFMS